MFELIKCRKFLKLLSYYQLSRDFAYVLATKGFKIKVIVNEKVKTSFVYVMRVYVANGGTAPCILLLLYFNIPSFNTRIIPH